MARAAVSEIIDFLCELSSDENMRVTVVQAARGGLIAGGAAAAGGLVGGPVGIAVGAAVGGLVAAGTSTDFKPVAVVIRDMPSHKKDRLAGRVRDILTNRDVQALAALAVTTGAAGAVRNEVCRELQRYVVHELNMKMA